MKPTGKQISDLKTKIEDARKVKGLSYADLSKMTNVHASQVSRICSGGFRTFSNNVVQICTALGVKVPRVTTGSMDADWAKAHASLLRIWDRTPEGAETIRRVLDAIAELQTQAPRASGKAAQSKASAPK